MIEKAREVLMDRSPEVIAARHISVITLSLSREKFNEAKRRIERFKLEMSEFLTDDEAEEVVQLNIQFIPLTKPE